MELPFVTLDVFTTTPFQGNPLAVVTIPASLPAPPTQAQKQAIAREFNLSETVFIHDADPQAPPDQRNIDIFLIDREIPFAGHPTIGAAVSLLTTQDDTQDQGDVPSIRAVIAKAGRIELTRTGPRSVEAGIPHNVHVHAKRLRDLDLQQGQNALALSSDATIRQAELDAPVVSIVKGMTFLLVELPDCETLSKAQINSLDVPLAELLDEGWQDSFLGRYYYVPTPDSSSPSPGKESAEVKDAPVKLQTRMIENNMEDPATGSAASALCSYLSLTQSSQSGDGATLTRYEVTQGVDMGRESNMSLSISVKGAKIDTVKLSGTATQVMRGFVQLPPI